MALKKSIKKYAGVYYTESTVNEWRKHPDKIYWVAFKDSATGKLHWERCGAASEGWTPEAAQKRRYELLEKKRVGEYKSKKENKGNQMTLREFMESHYLPWTVENQKYPQKDSERYRKWIAPDFSNLPMKDLTPLHLEQLKNKMRQQGKSEAMVKHVLSIIRQAFNKAAKWGLWNGRNPCSAIDFPKLANERRRFLSQEEATNLLNTLRERHKTLYDLSIFSLFGGMRLGEIFNLKWSNIDRRHGIIFVLDSKNNDSRPIFITAPIKSVLDELPSESPNEFLFKSTDGSQMRWLSGVFKTVVEEIGLNKGITDPREKVTFHTLRHTYASWAVMKGVPLYVVGKAMGHKTTTMTQRYAHLAPDSQRIAFEAVAENNINHLSTTQE